MSRRTQWSLFLVIHFLAFAPAAALATTTNGIDGDNDIDLTDFGILKANFGKHASAAADEPSASHVVDYNKGDAPVLSSAGIGVLSTTGDVDGDGDLDLSDFGILKANFGKTDAPFPATSIPGDLNGDNKVDMTDFGILKANFGKHSAASPTPEPSTWLLAVLAGMGLAAVRRKKLLA